MTDLFQDIGGVASCRRLSQCFYARVQQDPVLRPLFPGKTLHCAIEELSAFLVQFLGGPAEDSQRRWWLSLHESHRRFKIRGKHRAAWLRLMSEALAEARIPEPQRSALGDFFERSSAYLIESAPPVGQMQPELACRWSGQLSLDEAVAAIRRGDAVRAIELAGACDRGVRGGLYALMIRSGIDPLMEYVHQQVAGDPTLVRERYAGWTLLHIAAGSGRITTAELLLTLGAHPDELDGGKHTPLYSVGTECAGPAGPAVVRVLVGAGANVNANGGVTRCTPLHMAARRGNAVVAQALLECGANANARDSRGQTPLQRALNCRKSEVAALLRSIEPPR
jgi:truncated hemoglobin YjbI